jgi:hypothetical protein
MKPTLTGTGFGWIDVGDERISHDILICLDGKVSKRKKKLSKEVYGTSHKISLAEAEFIFEDGAKTLIIGGGQFGRVRLSPEAIDYFRERNCQVKIHPTPKAITAWNNSEGKTIGLFHITC